MQWVYTREEDNFVERNNENNQGIISANSTGFSLRNKPHCFVFYVVNGSWTFITYIYRQNKCRFTVNCRGFVIFPGEVCVCVFALRSCRRAIGLQLVRETATQTQSLLSVWIEPLQPVLTRWEEVSSASAMLPSSRPLQDADSIVWQAGRARRSAGGDTAVSMMIRTTRTHLGACPQGGPELVRRVERERDWEQGPAGSGGKRGK